MIRVNQRHVTNTKRRLECAVLHTTPKFEVNSVQTRVCMRVGERERERRGEGGAEIYCVELYIRVAVVLPVAKLRFSPPGVEAVKCAP